MTNPNIIFAPWTQEQVDGLNAFQRSGVMHPFTCPDHTPGSPSLVAHTDGWRCSDPYGEGCPYQQDWAHTFMTKPLPPIFFPKEVHDGEVS